MPMSRAVPHATRRSRPRRFATAALLLGLGACAGAPETGERGLSASAARVLAVDFGERAVAKRSAAVVARTRLVADELGRTRRLAAAPALAGAELARTRAVTETAPELLGAELARRPRPHPALLPDPRELAQRLADDIFIARLLLLPPHPLGEIDDRRHRVDPNDDRPEKGLWERLRRRLWP